MRQLNADRLAELGDKVDDFNPSKPLPTLIYPNSIDKEVPIFVEKVDEFDDALNRLAKLIPIEFEKIAKAEAKSLGIGITVLRALVKDAQKTIESEINSPFPAIEPWGEPVNISNLLDDITHSVKKYIICKDETANAVALWVAMTYLLDSIRCCPLAIITAPEKGCGKSKLLEVVGMMAFKPLPTSSITPAALFRSIDLWRPTLLIDETDTFLKENEELRGVLNSGHTRASAFTIRCDGEKNEPRTFSTWSAKMLSGIGNNNLHDTITSRAIFLEMRKKLPNEVVAKLKSFEDPEFKQIREKLLRWANDNKDLIEKADPQLPKGLDDRTQDNWGSLLAIADLAGEEWGAKARSTALSISKADSGKSISQELLEDIQEILDKQSVDKIFLSELAIKLNAIDDAPWMNFKHGKGIDSRWLGAKLSEYKITAHTVRIGIESKKGYDIEQFDDTFKRYLLTPDLLVTSVTQSQPISSKPVSVTEPTNVTESLVTCDQEHFPSVTNEPIWNKGCDRRDQCDRDLGMPQINQSTPKHGISEIEI